MVSNGAEIQPDKNWTRINNSILELLATTNFTARELRCLLFLFRTTYGFNRKEQAISYTEWEQGTNMRRAHIHATLQGLVARKVIVKTDTGTRSKSVWAFNKYFEQWLPVTPIGNKETVTPLGNSDVTPLGNETVTPVQSTTTPIKEKRQGKDSEPACLPLPVEQRNGYFGMPVPVRRERVTADGYTQDAAKCGVDAKTFVAIFNVLIDTAGWRDLVDAGSDKELNWAKESALTLVRLGNTTPEHITTLADAYRKANEWRSAPPKPKDLAEYASQLKAGVLREGKKETRPGANREIVEVRFAKIGDDIYA